MKIKDIQIVGLHYYVKSEEVEKVIGRCVGKQLFAERERDNAYDKNAIAIYAKRHKVGYIKAVHAEILAGMMDTGGKLKVVLKDVKGSRYRLITDLEVSV